MKRTGALVCIIMLAVTMLAPAAFAVEDQTVSAKTALEMVDSSPKDGTKDVAGDNFSVKIYFNKDVLPANDKIKKENAKQFKLVSEDGKKIPIKVYYSSDEEGLILVAADVVNAPKDVQIKGNKEYKLTIKEGFQASDGTTMAQKEVISLKTLNQQRSTVIYMLLMALMMGGMIFFTMRSAKKAEEKEKEEKRNKEAVNPYKEAKRTGKTVEEIVAKEAKKKQKKSEAEERQREAEAALEAEIMEQIRRESNKRVSGPRPISAVGISYHNPHVEAAKKKEEQKSTKGTTNPKNQSGKKKNQTGKKNKKK